MSDTMPIHEWRDQFFDQWVDSAEERRLLEEQQNVHFWHTRARNDPNANEHTLYEIPAEPLIVEAVRDHFYDPTRFQRLREQLRAGLTISPPDGCLPRLYYTYGTKNTWVDYDESEQTTKVESQIKEIEMYLDRVEARIKK